MFTILMSIIIHLGLSLVQEVGNQNYFSPLKQVDTVKIKQNYMKTEQSIFKSGLFMQNLIYSTVPKF